MRSFGFKLERSAGVKPAPPQTAPGLWDLSFGNGVSARVSPRCLAPVWCGERRRERAEASDTQMKKKIALVVSEIHLG